MSFCVSTSTRLVVSPSMSSNFSPAVVNGRLAFFFPLSMGGHLVNSVNRQAQRLCGRRRRRSISKRGAGEKQLSELNNQFPLIVIPTEDFSRSGGTCGLFAHQ